MPYMTDKSSRSTHTLAGGHRERTASGMPYRKQSHDCRGIILSVTMMILIVITAFRLPPQGASKAFLISWHSASLIPRGQDPTSTPCQPVYVFKIWKDERKQVPFVFLFPIATVSGKNWISETWALQLSPSSLPYQPPWGCRGWEGRRVFWSSWLWVAAVF